MTTLNQESNPPAPRNVRIVRHGREIPVDCVYVGSTRDGVAVWLIAGHIVNPRTDQIRVEELPGKCGITAHCGEVAW